MYSFTKFKADKVSLQGTNIIEASAGTGKTYSIAIMVLRLIIEQSIPLPKILMVTFTKAAVAELELRLHKFIRLANEAVETQHCPDTTILDIVNRAKEIYGAQQITHNLLQARRQLDETSIFTIHGFCQRTLGEYAFESGQLFNANVIPNVEEMIETGVNHFWRTHITTLPIAQLKLLLKHNFTRDTMMRIASFVLDGKTFVAPQRSVEQILKQLEEAPAEAEKSLQHFAHYMEHAEECTIEYMNGKGRSFLKKNFVPLLNNPKAFHQLVIAKQGTKGVATGMPKTLSEAIKVKDEQHLINNAIESIYACAAQYVVSFVNKRKNELATFSFNDLIEKLHQALQSDNKNRLISLLQKQYKAVFIDEFQDTDQIQFEIFNTLFSTQTTIFYIGDPKQSIYRFRGADMETYKMALSKVQHHYTMNTNYRSTPQLVAAYNQWYSALPDAFVDDQIKYEPVEAVTKAAFTLEGNHATHPIEIMECNKVDLVKHEVVTQIVNLLTGEGNTIDQKRIVPSDIGILVKDHRKAQQYKDALTKQGIPSINMEKANVLQTAEAQFIIYLLETVIDPSQSNLNKLLISNYIGLKRETLLCQSIENDIAHFRNLAIVHKKEGVYAMCKQFFALYNVQNHIATCGMEQPERSISNLLQIVELLHRKSTHSNAQLHELLSWMQQSFTSSTTKADEDIQRLESDKNAVQIVTVHKSKGLAYNILFAPDLTYKPKAKPKSGIRIYDFKDRDTKKHSITISPTQQQMEQYNLENEQEFRRLIYVALTRSVYATYIYYNRPKGSSLEPFINNATYVNGIQKVEPRNNDLSEKQPYNYTQQTQANTLQYQGSNIVQQWRNTSFSSLSDAHGFTPYQPSEEDDYDAFALDLLPRGAESGNLLHYIFEHIDYNALLNNKLQHTKVIKRAAEEFHSFYTTEEGEIDTNNYLQLINHVLESKLSMNGSTFTLSEINDSHKLPELEFSFSLESSNINAFAKAAGVSNYNNLGTINGMMSGFIDLMFEHMGKYYILDWKSNYIGNSLQHYTADKIEQSMQENNYHLQYQIYTIALCRYLKANIPNFDYDKHFGGAIYVYLRGCRANETTGIFTHKPNKEHIELLDSML